MIAPPYECPTRMIGPVMVCRKLAMDVAFDSKYDVERVLW